LAALAGFVCGLMLSFSYRNVHGPVHGKFAARPMPTSVFNLRRSHAAAINPVPSRAAAITNVAIPPLRKNKHALGMLAAQAGARTGCRRQADCMMKVGLFYSTSTGNTETVAEYIAEEGGLEAVDVGDISPGDLAGFDGLIVGAPTWHTGADTERSGTAWDEILEEIKGVDLSGKPVAVFGCGDASGYSDNFCDAIEEIYETFKATGAKMLGSVDASAYTYDDSKSVVDGKFLGLATDEDNESDLSEERVKAWLSQLKTEGMPL